MCWWEQPVVRCLIYYSIFYPLLLQNLVSAFLLKVWWWSDFKYIDLVVKTHFVGYPHVWMPPCMFGYPICLDTPYVWIPHVGMPPICLDTPTCLDTLLYAWMPPYVWKMFGCLLYIYNTNKTCFVRLRGVSICPPYIWMSPYVWTAQHLDAPHLFGCCPCMFGCLLHLDNPL